MNQKEQFINNDIEKRDRIIANLLCLTYEELSQTTFDLEENDNQSYIKILFIIEHSSSEILSKITGLQDGYWTIIESISIPN